MENSIYDMKGGAHSWGTFSPFVFTFRLLILRFLWLSLTTSRSCQQSSTESGFLSLSLHLPRRTVGWILFINFDEKQGRAISRNGFQMLTAKCVTN
jgi:hypothetical protein